MRRDPQGRVVVPQAPVVDESGHWHESERFPLGEAGGEVLVTGTPEQVAEADDSSTGQFLRQLLPAAAAAA